MLKFTLRFTINAFIVNLNVNFNILKQFNCALVGQMKDLMSNFNSDGLTYTTVFLPSVSTACYMHV
jgi:hypothetical protein